MRFVAEGKKFPKVLVIGQTFNKASGGGITVSNLFYGWPKENLAVASVSFIGNELDLNVCANYFQLSYNGKLHPFPVNIFLPKIKHGPICLDMGSFQGQRVVANHKPLKYLALFGILKVVMDFFGVYNFFYRTKISPDFYEWVNEYNPDIIYSPLNTLEMLRLVNDLHVLTNKPVAVHMWDDWPSYINKPGILFYYWEKIIDSEFRRLINNSSVLMGISESMRLEYLKRYKKDFTPFHNPIEIEKWLPFSKKDWKKKEKFTILYAGRIGIGMKDSIIEFADVINELSKQYKDLVFEVQTNLFFAFENRLKLNGNVRHLPPIGYDQLPKKFSSVDLLLLPVDFDKTSIDLIKLSFMTKISEYMISGTPVLVYAHPSTEVARFASESGWGFVVTENDPEKLKDAVLKLYHDETLRKSLGTTAMKIASEKENAHLVREEFKKMLLSAVI